MPAAAKKTDRLGDAFVIVSAAGLFWNGRRFADDRAAAALFDEPPDPYAQAAAVIKRLRGRGVVCWPLYLTRPQLAAFLGPKEASGSPCGNRRPSCRGAGNRRAACREKP
jgi:hypothetical protein